MNTKPNTETPEVINFGKFKGTALVDLKHGYVNWLLSLDNLNEVLRKNLEALPWVQEAHERECAFQKRKALAIGLQSSHIPLRDRRAYKKRMGWVGA